MTNEQSNGQSILWVGRVSLVHGNYPTSLQAMQLQAHWKLNAICSNNFVHWQYFYEKSKIGTENMYGNAVSKMDVFTNAMLSGP